MSEPNSTIGLLSLIALIAINAIVSAAHSSFVNARKGQLRELADQGNQRAQRALDLSENATRLLTSRQFISVVLHTLAVGIATVMIARPLVLALNVDQTLSMLVYLAAWLITALLLLILGELIPEILAERHPESFAMLTVGPMTILLRITAPLAHFTLWFSKKAASPFGSDTPYVTEEEIKTLVDAGSEEGVLEDEAKEMIYSIFQFNDTVAHEIMVPRIDIVALEAMTPLRDALNVVLTHGHSRIPIYEGTIDHVAGLLYAKDMLRTGQDMDRPVREFMRPAYFIPESKKAGALLEELQARKIHMAIVIDEYGGTAGLVTIEDLLEEIVGDIQDEYDAVEEAEYQKLSDDEYLFDAGISLNDVNELLETELPTNESDTLGGYVFSALGKVPLAGETFKTDDLDIKVEEITGRRIRKVRVRRIVPPTESPVQPAEEPKPQPVQAQTEISGSGTLEPDTA